MNGIYRNYYLGLVILLFSGSAHAQIFVCERPNGQQAFQDKPCEATDISVRTTYTQPNKKLSNSPVGDNLVRNASFEAGLELWNTQLGVTHEQGTPLNSTNVIRLAFTPEAASDSRSILLASQCFPLKGTTKVSFSARGMVEKPEVAGPSNQIALHWYDSEDCRKGGRHGYSAQLERRRGWQRFTFPGLMIPEGSKAGKIIILQAIPTPGSEAAYWDDIVVRPIEALNQGTAASAASVDPCPSNSPDNLIANGMFNAGHLGWRTRMDLQWNTESGHCQSGAVLAKLSVKSSTRTTSTALYQCINLTAKGRYRWGTAFKPRNPQLQHGPARLQVSWYGEKSCAGHKLGSTSSSSKPIEECNGLRKIFSIHRKAQTARLSSFGKQLLDQASSKDCGMMYI
jgi:hypothetical protein